MGMQAQETDEKIIAVRHSLKRNGTAFKHNYRRDVLHWPRHSLYLNNFCEEGEASKNCDMSQKKIRLSHLFCDMLLGDREGRNFFVC